MPLLGDLFSAGDRAKRRLLELAADPRGQLALAAEQLRDGGGRPMSAAQVAASLDSPEVAQMAQDFWNPGGPAESPELFNKARIISEKARPAHGL